MRAYSNNDKDNERESACNRCAYQIGCPRRSEEVKFCEFRGEWKGVEDGK